MTGVERLKQVVGFPTTHLSQNDPIGAMAQGGFQQFADGHGGAALLFAPSFEADKVRGCELEFGDVLDDYKPVLRWKEYGQGIQESGLARAGAAADQDIVAVIDGLAQDLKLVRGESAKSDELVGGEVMALELADGQRRTAKAHRWYRRGDARAIGQTGVEQRPLL